MQIVLCDGVSHHPAAYYTDEGYMRKILVSVVIVACVFGSASARRLKIFSYSKSIAAGQYAYIIFENPNPEQVVARTKCDADKLMAWAKMDVPILRIDQNGKQIFTTLGSYQTMGDSCVATWIVPTTLSAGDANLFVLNDREASTPYKFTVTPSMQCHLIKAATVLKPSEEFTLVGEGYVPVDTIDRKITLEKLKVNFAYDKLSKSDQFTELNKKMKINWTMVSTGNVLTISQGASTWMVFVEGCGIDKDGVTLDFTCPSDIKPGKATLTLAIRYNGNDVAKSDPLEVIVP